MPSPSPYYISVAHGTQARPCNDGLFAEWAYWTARGLDKAFGPDVFRVGYAHDEMSNARAEKEVRERIRPNTFLSNLDMALHPGFLDTALASGKVVAMDIIDHHASAERELASYTPPSGVAFRKVFDTSRRSAALLVWETEMPGAPVPAMLKVNDVMDGGARDLRGEDNIAAAECLDNRLNGLTLVQAFAELQKMRDMPFNALVQEGLPFSRRKNREIEDILADSFVTRLQVTPDGTAVPVTVARGAFQGKRRDISPRLVARAKENGGEVALLWNHDEKTGITTAGIRTDGITLRAADVAEHLKTITHGQSGGGNDAAVLRCEHAVFEQHVLSTVDAASAPRYSFISVATPAPLVHIPAPARIPAFA